MSASRRRGVPPRVKDEAGQLDRVKPITRRLVMLFGEIPQEESVVMTMKIRAAEKVACCVLSGRKPQRGQMAPSLICQPLDE